MTERRRDDSGLDVTVPSADAMASADTAMAKSRGIDSVMQSASVLASANTVVPSSIDRPIPAGPEVLPIVAPEVYLHLDEFARGGLGRIVRAKDTRTGRVVAIKEMLHSTADAAARFVREALVTANLQHPAIVPVYEVGRWTTGQPFYAMKLVRGRPLDQAIAACKGIDERLGLLPHVVTVADALAYAHGEKVIHRDLKPANVLCGSHGETVVIDWGLARRLDDHDGAVSMPRISSAPPGATYVGAVMGTPSYMPPEQARGERVDERADVYAIGALLYHTLAGRPPYVGKTLQELIETVKSKPPPPLREIEPRVPPDLAAIVEHAMDRDLGKRYPSAKELANDLKRFTDGQLVLAHHYTKAERARRFIARNRGILAIATIGLVTLAIVGGAAISGIMSARRDAERESVRADEQRDEANRHLVTAYLDRGRTELSNGNAEPALAFAVVAAKAADGASKAEIDDELRYVAARSLDSLPAARRITVLGLTAIRFVPDSNDLLFASPAGVVRWDPERDRQVWTAQGDTIDMTLLGSTLAIANRTDRIELIDTATGKVTDTLRPSGKDRKFSAYLGGDRAQTWIAAPTADSVEVFDAAKRQRVASIPVAKVDNAPMMSPDGKTLALNVPTKTSFVQKVVLVDHAGNVIAEPCVNCSRPEFVGDNELVIPTTAEQGKPSRVLFIDWRGKIRLEVAPTTTASVLHVVSDVKLGRFALLMQDGVVEVRDLATGKLAWQTKLRDRAYLGEFDRLGRLWVLGSYHGTTLYDTMSGVELARWNVGGLWFVRSGERDRVAVLQSQGTVATWPVGETIQQAIAPGTRVRRVVFLADGSVVSGSDDGAINLHDLAGKRRELGKHGARVTELEATKTGGLLSSGRDGVTTVRDLAGNVTVRIQDGPRASIASDGWIATGNDTSTITLWDRDGRQRRILGQVGSRPVMAVHWSPDGKLVGGIDETGAFKVWGRDGTLIRELPSIKGGVDLVFSPDSAWVVRCAREPDPKLVSLTGGADRALTGLRETFNQTYAAVFTKHGHKLLLAGSGHATIWNVATGTLEIQIPMRTDLVAAAFILDERLIVAGGIDRKVHVWNASTGAEVAAIDAPDEVYGIVTERGDKRIAVLTLGPAVLWRQSKFAGDLQKLSDVAACRSTHVVANGVATRQTIDVARCNKQHAAEK